MQIKIEQTATEQIQNLLNTLPISDGKVFVAFLQEITTKIAKWNKYDFMKNTISLGMPNNDFYAIPFEKSIFLAFKIDNETATLVLVK